MAFEGAIIISEKRAAKKARLVYESEQPTTDARVDIYTDLLLGFNHDLFSQPRFEDVSLGPTGALARKVTAREAVNSAIWAWESMHPRLFQWAFTSVGYVAEDRMKKT